MKRIKNTKTTKGGYPLNKNGMPINKIGVNPLSSKGEANNYIIKLPRNYTKIGIYRPSSYNINYI